MDEHDPGESLANPPTASIELRDLGEAQSSIGIGQSLHVEDDDAKRAQQLEELRRQLSVGSSEHRHNDSHTGRGRSASHRGYEEPVERHLQDVQNANNPANPAEIKQLHTERKRKVQWVGVEDEGHHSAHYNNNRAHVAIDLPTTPSIDEGGDYSWNTDTTYHAVGHDNASDGTQTPGTMPNTPDASRPASPITEPLNIPSGERDGLPINVSSTRAGRAFTKEAAKLVAVHKAKGMFMNSVKNRGNGSRHATSSREASPVRRHETIAAGAQYDDEVAPGADRPTQGVGVLSALLKLYEQPQSVHSSSTTLVPSRSGSPARPTHTHHEHDQRHSQHGNASPPDHGSHRPRTPQLQQFISKAADRVQHFRDDRDRPAAARSKGGVFGALQASAFSLGGAASPMAVTVVPAPDRPGYKLDRHSLANVPTVHTNGMPKSGSASPEQTTSTRNSPELRPSHPHRKTGSTLNLNQLAHLPQQIGRLPETIAKSSEAWGKEHLDPKKYYRESNTYKAAKSAATPGSVPGTPRPDYFDGSKATRRKKDKRRQEEIFITMHVAAILQRQDFILRLARALMMFGAPSHRLEYQLQQTAKVLEIECQVIYIVNFCIISFSDADTHTSEIKFIKQAAGLNLGKLTDLAILHWEVVHDKIGVQEASMEISDLMRAKPYLSNWAIVAVGAWSSIMIGMASFNASFVDLLVAAPLGAVLVAVQIFVAARSDVLSSIFEIVIAAVISFVAAAVASTEYFCFAAIVSSSIVLILPGWPVCVAALELQSRSLVSGSVRLVYAVVYSLFLGFGISLGANIWVLCSGQQVVTTGDGSCSIAHPATAAWWHQTIPQWFYFLAVPGFPIGLALRNGARLNKELIVMVLIAGAGWNANHWSTYGFPGRSDISSALGALAVGFLGNLWGKFFQSTSFIVAVVGVLFQLPSGLGNGGLLNFASTTSDATQVIGSGFNVAQQLITVVIGLVVGLLVSCALFYPFGKRRGGLMTF